MHPVSASASSVATGLRSVLVPDLVRRTRSRRTTALANYTGFDNMCITEGPNSPLAEVSEAPGLLVEPHLTDR